MTTIEQALNPARAITAAVTAILKEVVPNVYPTFSDEDKQTPYAEFHLQGLANNGKQQSFKGTTLWVGWDAVLVCRIGTHRGRNSDDHEKIVDHVLANMVFFKKAFSEKLLPSHEILDARLASYVPSVEAGETNFTDRTEIQHKLSIDVREWKF